MRGPVGVRAAHYLAGAQVFFAGLEIAQRDALRHRADHGAQVAANALVFHHLEVPLAVFLKSNGLVRGVFAGNVAAPALDACVLVDEGLVDRSREVGNYFMGRLKRIESEHIKEVRGKGLLIGVEMTDEARPYCDALRDAGILCKDTHGTVVRFAPPLVISKEEIDWAMERIEPILSNGHK